MEHSRTPCPGREGGRHQDAGFSVKEHLVEGSDCAADQLFSLAALQLQFMLRLNLLHRPSAPRPPSATSGPQCRAPQHLALGPSLMGMGLRLSCTGPVLRDALLQEVGEFGTMLRNSASESLEIVVECRFCKAPPSIENHFELLKTIT